MKKLIILYIVLLIGCASCPKSIKDIKPNSDYSNCNMDVISLRGANFKLSNLTNATFITSDLTGADLSGANITNVDFSYANLSGATLLGSYSGKMYGSKLIDTNGIKTYKTNFSNTIWFNGKICLNGSITDCNYIYEK